MKRMVLVIALCLAFVACNEELTHPSGLASDPTSLMRTDHAASLTPVSLDSLVRGGNFVFTLHVRFAMAGQWEYVPRPQQRVGGVAVDSLMA